MQAVIGMKTPRAGRAAFAAQTSGSLAYPRRRRRYPCLYYCGGQTGKKTADVLRGAWHGDGRIEAANGAVKRKVGATRANAAQTMPCAGVAWRRCLATGGVDGGGENSGRTSAASARLARVVEHLRLHYQYVAY